MNYTSYFFLTSNGTKCRARMAKLKEKHNLKIKGAYFICLFLINDMAKKLKDLEMCTDFLSTGTGNLTYPNKS